MANESKQITKDRIKTIKIDEEVQLYVDSFCEKEKPLYIHLQNLITDSGISVSELIKNSCLNKNYAYNILSGSRSNPSRDKILALCIGAGISFDATQETLDVARLGRLYYKSERDVRIAASINADIRNVLKVNLILESHGLSVIDV